MEYTNALCIHRKLSCIGAATARTNLDTLTVDQMVDMINEGDYKITLEARP